MMQRIRQAADRPFDPIDIAPLIVFRIAFGALMLWEVWRYFEYDRISRYYVEPTFWFHYFGFEWVRPLPGDGMFLLFHLLGALSVLIILGAFYRLSMTLFWLCFTYVFLLDKTQYLNHFYLVSLVSFLLIFVPTHRALSIDAWRKPSLRTDTVPAWTLWLLRGQMGIVYFFGGLAKLNPDWLVGEPLREWMGNTTDFPLIGHLFTEEWMVYLFSYGGLLLDLFIVPLLLWRRTRIPALLLSALFHLMNARLFNIGIFPWFAIAATLMFMPPHWFRPRWLRLPEAAPVVAHNSAHKMWILGGIALYFAIQIALPLRHWLYPGDPSWTEEGHTLAWHMRLRQKAGDITFYAADPASGTTWQLPAADHLSARQFRQMQDNPDMILRFVHYLARTLAVDYPNLQIYVRSMMSLNSRTPQLLIDPTADLTREPDNLLASDWILPLVQRPSPHPPVPVLLISRRTEGVLLLMNVGATPYSISSLRIETSEHHLQGDALGVTALLPYECLIVHTDDADLANVFVPCNETGARVVIAPALLHDRLQVTTDAETSECAGASCVVAGAAGS
ncbi:MAG: HTTM domain-containing protein [Chloroflexota bacterium]|nr:HTTM domain-containing protein [Chloroflexota bacterium]